MASISCLITIIEAHSNDGILDMIDMVNDFRVGRKQLLLMVPDFDKKMFGNITINYDVTIAHGPEGNVCY